MVFLLILTLSFGAQALFSFHLFNTGTVAGIVIGAVQLTVFLISLTFLMRNFRRSRTTDYRKAFNAFGAMIASGVPTFAYLPFGLVFLITGWKPLEITGWVLSGVLFISILVGILYGRWNWKVRTVSLSFDHLPEDLHRTRIVQISDVHVGSFFNRQDKVKRAIEMINALEADFVLFTGDLVNNIAAEMHGWEPLFGSIQAKVGKYSILGNHDYGDYVKWEADQQKQSNLESLIAVHESIGFTPLLNSHVQISSEGKGAYIIGVENWGTAPFRQSGDLQKAGGTLPDGAFKLLMSHDPSHFDEQVVGTDIDLTLSGHTHGMQFGIERFGIKWSPVSFRYKKWAGLYNVGKQFLYVNRGFGYLGFPGRVGIYPEITLIELNGKG